MSGGYFQLVGGSGNSVSANRAASGAMRNGRKRRERGSMGKGIWLMGDPASFFELRRDPFDELRAGKRE